MAAARKIEILDLRHFSAPALRPLLLEEAAIWQERLLWDYSRSVELLLEYINNRSLTGYVAMRDGRVAGYAFGVMEASKAVLGDAYAFGEGNTRENPVCDLLLDHLLETVQAMPGIRRVESQLLLFPQGSLHDPYRSRGLASFPRLFMTCDLLQVLPLHRLVGRQMRVEPWRPELYHEAAALIHTAYAGHTDSEINDQYQSFVGAKRFLHNIVHFPGCGVFDAADSWCLRHPESGDLLALILCSRVHERAAHITQLCVSPALRAQGFGGYLLQHCLLELQRHGMDTVSLTVTASNSNARRVYERNGFTTRHQFEAWIWNKDGKTGRA